MISFLNLAQKTFNYLVSSNYTTYWQVPGLHMYEGLNDMILELQRSVWMHILLVVEKTQYNMILNHNYNFIIKPM